MAPGSASVGKTLKFRQPTMAKPPTQVDIFCVSDDQGAVLLLRLSVETLSKISNRYIQDAPNMPVNAANVAQWRLNARDVNAWSAKKFFVWASNLDLGSNKKHTMVMPKDPVVGMVAAIHHTLLFLDPTEKIEFGNWRQQLSTFADAPNPSAHDLLMIWRAVRPEDGLRSYVAYVAIQYTTSDDSSKHFSKVFAQEKVLYDDYMGRLQKKKDWVTQKKEDRAKEREEKAQAKKALAEDRYYEEMEEANAQKALEIKRDLGKKGSGINSISYEKGELVKRY